MKKLGLMFILSTFLGISILTGCNSPNKSNAKSTANIEHSDKCGTVYLMAGKINTNESVNISSKISAKVTETYVDIGSTVKKGDPIMKLDSKDLEAQLVKAEASVGTAQANLAKTQSGSRPEEIHKAQALVDSTNVSYENAKKNYERNQKLFDTGAISKSQLEQFQTALAEADASYKSSKAELDILNKGETQEAINVAESQVKEAQAALDISKIQIDNSVIVSPISGVVTAKDIRTGELATAGVNLVNIVNSDAMVVDAYLPVEYINKIKVGQEVVIKAVEVPDKEFNGEISVIDSVVNLKNKNILVKVKFKNQDVQLKPGMFAEVGVKN